MPNRLNRDLGTSLPSARTELQFRGFPEFRSNVLYCPKQFFTVVIPNSSVNCIRVVAHMLRKTLGWVDENGDPIQEQHEFSHRDLEQAAGVSHSRLNEALDDALKFNFIRRVQKARVQIQGVRAKSAAFELRWDESRYTDELSSFHGFYIHPSYTDDAGQNRIGRKNIPNIFFDYLIREENRALIRVVGTLLWYSIDWGKGGERRTTVRKSLRDLVELTQLAKGSVVRALDEAVEKGYIERVEPGVFDLAGNQQGSITVYGIKWTKDYTYTHDGLAVSVDGRTERPQNETRPFDQNAPKMRHGKRSQNETRNAPKTRPAERSQNETIRSTKTNIPNTSINNNSDSPALVTDVVAAEDALNELLKIGFGKTVAQELLGRSSAETVLRQIALLPKRSATKNPLGLLRKAIEENWNNPTDSLTETTDVGSSQGAQFAAHFYAGYHGNIQAPVAVPSPADTAVAATFVSRLLECSDTPANASTWGREFGQVIAYHHRSKREKFPSLVAAIRQFGDEFYARLRQSTEADRQAKFRDAQAAHFERNRGAYLAYLRTQLKTHERQESKLYAAFLAEETEALQALKRNQFGLKIEKLLETFTSEAARLDRFERFLVFAEDSSVLDFWSWDRELNPKKFQGGQS